MDYDPRLLRYILAIDRAGSFVRAAETLNISQPALSVAISRLEDLAEAKLVDRGRHGAVLTEAGRVLARHGASIEAVLDLAHHEMVAHNRGIAGPLHVGGTPLASGSFLPLVIAKLLNENKSVAIEVTEDTDESLKERLMRNELDIIVSNVWHNRSEDGIEQIPLFTARSVVVVRSGHSLEGRGKVSLPELVDLTWVTPPKGGAFRSQLEALFATNGVPFPANLVEAAPFSVLKAIIQRSDAVSILSDQFLRDDIRSGALSAIPLKEHLASRRFAMQKLAGRELNALGKQFVETAREIATSTSLELKRYSKI